MERKREKWRKKWKAEEKRILENGKGKNGKWKKINKRQKRKLNKKW